MTLSRAPRWTVGFAFDLLVGIVPGLILLVLNLILALALFFLASLGFSVSSLPELLNNALGIAGMLLLAAIPFLGATACLALIGALIVRHRAGGLDQLSTKWREFLRIFLTLGMFFSIPGFFFFGRDNPFALQLGQDFLKSLGQSGVLILNAYLFLFPAAMSYRILRLLKTAGGST